MKNLDVKRTHKLLNQIMEFELAGVVRYTHYSLMITGPNRIPIVQFMKAQASESLLHAQQVGELLTGLEGHPSLRIASIEESHQHNVETILHESLAHEEKALDLYKALLDTVKGPDFPTGAFIYGSSGILDAYRHGRGSFIMRVRAHADRPGGAARDRAAQDAA